PCDRRAAVSADARAARLLLVPAEAAACMSIDEPQLLEWVTQQRWFGAKSRAVAHARILDRVELRAAEPKLGLALAEIRYETGAHAMYQLLYADDTMDGLEQPGLARELMSALRSGLTIQGADGIGEFKPAEGFAGLGRELEDARPVGAEQSNSSVV